MNGNGIKTPYKKGWYSKANETCPYGTNELKQRCAWLAGKADKENGYKLDLTVFED